jgi:hypothetical protein
MWCCRYHLFLYAWIDSAKKICKLLAVIDRSRLPRESLLDRWDCGENTDVPRDVSLGDGTVCHIADHFVPLPVWPPTTEALVSRVVWGHNAPAGCIEKASRVSRKSRGLQQRRLGRAPIHGFG